jgi:DNA repair exonuclease SbcCD ATPase subunit
LTTTTVSDPNPEIAEERTPAARSLDLVLQQLWDKARRISALVVRLREENAGLKERARELEESSRAIFNEREKLIVRMAQQEAAERSTVDEVASLRQRVRQLEDAETNTRRTLDEVSVHLEQARREVVRLQANGTGPFTREEKEQLRQRVAELITKISSRL